MLDIVLVRHGVSEGNLRRAYCGRLDVPLAEEGALGIRALRAQGAYPPTCLHFSSPLLRCRQTFEEAFGPQVRLDGVLDGFAEVDFGGLEGVSLSPDASESFRRRWIAGEPTPEAPGAESCAESRERAFAAVADLVARMEAKGAPSATVVTHSFFMRAVLTRLAGLGPRHWFDFDVPNGLGYVLEVDPRPFARGRSGLVRAVPFGPTPPGARRPTLAGPAALAGRGGAPYGGEGGQEGGASL